MQDEVLKLTMNSSVSFSSGSATLTPAFGATLAKVADVLTKYPKTNLNVIGHTDSSGSDALNQTLSEQRALSFAYALRDKGVDGQRLATAGRGETEPRADNATTQGKQMNRRVELFIIPQNNIQ